MINKVILVGRVGKEPVVRYTPDAVMVTSFSVATDEQWKDKNGERAQKTEWHNVTTFDRLADICGKYLTKGQLVYVEGKIQTRKWEDKEGQTRYSTGIIANTMKMLTGGKRDDSAQPPQEDGPSAPDNDVPF